MKIIPILEKEPVLLTVEKEFTGFLAFVMQHEIDHSYGINIYDKKF